MILVEKYRYRKRRGKWSSWYRCGTGPRIPPNALDAEFDWFEEEEANEHERRAG